MHYHFATEAKIKAILAKRFSMYTDRVLKFMESQIPPPMPRKDSLETEFELFMRKLEADLVIEGSSGVDLGPFVSKVLDFMLKFKFQEIADYMKTITGREFFGTTEWWNETKRQWVDILNKSVQKNIQTYTEKIRELVYTSIREGKSRNEILEAVKLANESLDEKKAAFIARDMTGKLNGIMEKNLQQSIGIDEYLWQTMRDEKVRGRPGGVYADKIPSHWLMESLVCKWSDPNVVSFDLGKTWVPRTADMPYLHPGEDWLCRCSGSPFSSSFLREIDMAIARERELNG